MEEEKVISNIEEGCIFCLNYFGIFNYPLTLEEIFHFNPFPCDKEDVRLCIEKLIVVGSVYALQNFYALENKQEWAEERIKGNKRAFELLSKSGKYINTIASFPFVRGIAISGSLSKFYASEKTDIDYFLITSADRLWIARSLLHLFKKLTFLTGHQHYYCMNYFIDTNALNISHKNYYTAVEAATLLAGSNMWVIKEFLKENKWIRDYLPNYPTLIRSDYLIKKRKRPVKAVFEKVLNLLAAEKLNNYLMNLTDRKWRKKWKGYSEADYNRAFQTEIAISRNHPADFEKKVLSQLSHKLKEQNK